MFSSALDFDGGVGLRARNIGFGELHGRNEALHLLAEVDDHSLLGVGDNFYFNNLVLSGAFLGLAVLLDELAHLLGAGGFFSGRSSFGVHRMFRRSRRIVGGSLRSGGCGALRTRVAVGLRNRGGISHVLGSVHGSFRLGMRFFVGFRV